MDVLLEPSLSVCSVDPSAKPRVYAAEALLAKSLKELVPEVSQLKRRGVRLVSLRRQQILRIGPAVMQQVLADSGLEISSIGFAGGFTGTLGHSFNAAVADTRRAIELAAGFRARSVIVVPGSLGLHTRGHAEETIREGLNNCLDDALRLRVNMLVPLNTVFGHRREVYQPRNQSPLDWISAMDSHRIRGLLMLRGGAPWSQLPDCWRRCLKDGGYLRVSPRCRATVGTQNLLNHVSTRLDISRRKITRGTRAG